MKKVFFFPVTPVAGILGLDLIAIPCATHTLAAVRAKATSTNFLLRKEGAVDKAIHPFLINVPEAVFTDMRQRMLATRWPVRERSRIIPRVCG